MKRVFSRGIMLAVAAGVLALTTSIASADGPGWETVSADFHGPLFGLNVAHDDDLLVAEAGNGAVKLDPEDGDTELLGSLPGISDVIQVGRGEYLALTGGGDPSDPDAESLFRIKNGTVTKIADLGAFEEAVDPAEDGVESNPFDLAKLSRNKTLVSDAAANSLLVVGKNGDIDWVASFPQFPSDDPEGIDPVPTTVAVGPDGDIYVGELMGFPPTPGLSRVWRIESDARHVKCLETNDEDDDCTLVQNGFTSIIDIQFGEDGTAYVLELDEATWLAAEGDGGLGGTVNACQSHGDDDDDDEGGAWSCEELATGLPFPLALAVDDESVYVTLALGPEGPVEVAQLTGTGDGGGDEGDDDNDD